MRRTRTPSASARAINCSTAFTSPDTTTAATPLTAPILSRSPNSAINSTAWACPQPSDTIAPAPANPTNNPLRNATTAAPSDSDNAPATVAAAISPCECPITASGTTPTDRHNEANDTITAHNTGCTTSTRSSPGAPPTPRTTSASDQSTNRPNASPHSRICSANTGEASNNCAPIPTHCEPCPGNTITVCPTDWARPTTTPTPAHPSANPDNPANNWARSTPITTARCSNTDRPANDTPTSTRPNPSSARTWATNRPACAANASPDLPNTTHGTTGNPTPEPPKPSTLSAALSATGGACSKITCALVPLIPNDDTPARRGPPPTGSTGQGRDSVNNDTDPTDQSTCGVGTSTCNVFGITPCRNACTILITPATPAAAWV